MGAIGHVEGDYEAHVCVVGRENGGFIKGRDLQKIDREGNAGAMTQAVDG